VEYRRCQPITLFGTVVYERAYYHCSDCKTGHFPTDAEFGLEHKQTLAARELITLAGVLEPFAENGETLLPRMAGLHASASTVRRTTEAAGADVAKRRVAGEVFGEGAVWQWHVDCQGKRVAYASLDATGIQQQGPGGRKAEGRMPWVAAVFNPWPPPRKKGKKKRRGQKRRQHQLRQVRYVSGLMSLPEIGGQLRRECQTVGLSQADVVIGLTDGGNGLENCLLDALAGLGPQIVFILDFYHVTEHMREFAKLWMPDESLRREQVRTWCQTLKRHGGSALVEELSALQISEAAPTIQESYRELLGYLRNNLHRMDYPTYLAHGWQIGSGVIEAACKSVVGRRMKCSGMRWSEHQTTPMCQLRALYRSSPNLWADYWHRITRKNYLRI
jgi:hypothetical protein